MYIYIIYICPHSAMCVCVRERERERKRERERERECPCYYICVLIYMLLCMCSHTAMYIPPTTTIDVSAYRHCESNIYN